jgi:hypothetical protein
VTETGLIVAQVVFLVLLYAFVWAVVRSSSRQVGAESPPPPPHPARARAPEMAMAAAPTPEAAAPPVTPVRPPAEDERPQPTAEPVPAAAGVAVEPAAAPSEEPATEVTVVRERGSGRLDLAANLHPRLVVEESPALAPGREIDLTGGITIGRSGAAGLSIADQFVSHMHARILRRGPYYFVEDLGSTNGTFLNERRVERDAQLKVRDSLRIGQTTLRYEE